MDNRDPQLGIRPLGDSAAIVDVAAGDGDSADILNDVLRVADVLRRAGIGGVTEVTSAFTTVALFYDPVRIAAAGKPIFDALEHQIRSALAETSSEGDVPGPSAPATVEIPVCYEEQFALDLDDIAAHAKLAPAEVIRLHSSAEYRVAAVGFTPGFPYLSGLPAELATPRRATPRTKVPAGSVAIGGSQAGIYPIDSPGGWHVIGRTPLILFDTAQDSPALLRAGDRVRFRAVSIAEFHTSAHQSRG